MALTEVHCLGCSIDISSPKGNHLLQTRASQVIVPLWSEIFGKELANHGLFREEPLDLVQEGNGRMCRKCFACFERCVKLLQTLKDGVCKAVDVVQSSLHSLQLESACEGRNTPCSSRIS